MVNERQRKDKIEVAFRENNMPLFKVWCEAAELNELESEVLFLKRFDERCLTEPEIIEILQKKFNYYYSDRAFRKFWYKIQKKIEKIIP